MGDQPKIRKEARQLPNGHYEWLIGVWSDERGEYEIACASREAFPREAMALLALDDFREAMRVASTEEETTPLRRHVKELVERPRLIEKAHRLYETAEREIRPNSPDAAAAFARVAFDALRLTAQLAGRLEKD